MDASLRAYAEQVLAGTGLTVDDLPLPPSTEQESAATKALRAGWRCATAPIPELPIAPYEEDER